MRIMAFKLAEQWNIEHRFSNESRLAGFPWLQLFLQRYLRLTLRKAERVSINRFLDMNKKTLRFIFTCYKVHMSEKSAFIKSDTFFQWLKDQFVPTKPTVTVLILLDGHASHCSNFEILICVEHNIIIFCLPSHTITFLKALDRCFLGR